MYARSLVVQDIFPGFKYLNLTKTVTVNPEIIERDPEREYKIIINTAGKEFIGNDGKSHRCFTMRMSRATDYERYGPYVESGSKRVHKHDLDVKYDEDDHISDYY